MLPGFFFPAHGFDRSVGGERRLVAALRLSDQFRTRLNALLADDRGDPERLMARLREWRRTEEAPAFAGALHLLAHLEIPDIQAEHLLEDSTVLAKRAEAAGVDVTLEEWEDMIHVFQFFPTLAEADQAITRIGDFVRSKTAIPATSRV